MFTHGSLFAGIGGFELAFEAAGFRTAWYSEIEPYCCKVLARRFPNAVNVGDIYTARPPYVDVITAGFPCQPFSDAGKKRGKDDERYLVPEMLRVISEVKPRVVFLENVPGFRTINDGNEFRELLQEIAEIGYDAEWCHLRASDVGAPHRRKRLLIVAYRDSEREPQPKRSKREFRRRASNGNQTVAHNTIKPVIDVRRERRNIQPPQREGQKRAARIGAGGAELAYARSRNSRPIRGKKKVETQTKPRLGRGAHGIPDRLDRHQFPAPPGPQYSWEPPRTTDTTENRAARLRALGNAVVPHAVYPVAVTIMEWLVSADAKE